MTIAMAYIHSRRISVEVFFTKKVTGSQWRAVVLVFRQSLAFESFQGSKHRTSPDEDIRIHRHSGHHRMSGVGFNFKDRSAGEIIFSVQA